MQLKRKAFLDAVFLTESNSDLPVMLFLAAGMTDSSWEVLSENRRWFPLSQYTKESFTLLFQHQKWQSSVVELWCMLLQVFILFCSEKSLYLWWYTCCSLQTAIDEANQISFSLLWKIGLYRNTLHPPEEEKCVGTAVLMVDVGWCEVKVGVWGYLKILPPPLLVGEGWKSSLD